MLYFTVFVDSPKAQSSNLESKLLLSKVVGQSNQCAYQKVQQCGGVSTVTEPKAPAPAAGQKPVRRILGDITNLKVPDQPEGSCTSNDLDVHGEIHVDESEVVNTVGVGGGSGGSNSFGGLQKLAVSTNYLLELLEEMG